jgi:hypothetical protein
LRRGGAYPPEHFLFSSALGLKLTANRRAILSRNFEAKITRPIRALIELIFALKRRKNEKTLENHRRASTLIKKWKCHILVHLCTLARSNIQYSTQWCIQEGAKGL